MRGFSRPAGSAIVLPKNPPPAGGGGAPLGNKGHPSSPGSPVFEGEGGESGAGIIGGRSKRPREAAPTSNSRTTRRRRAPLSPGQHTSHSCRWDGDYRPAQSPRLVEAPAGYENFRPLARKPLGRLVVPTSDDEREERLGLRGKKVRPRKRGPGERAGEDSPQKTLETHQRLPRKTHSNALTKPHPPRRSL